jgi:hypothetical protein
MEQEPVFEVLWPLARGTADAVGMAGRGAREGMCVGFLWDYVFRGDEMFAVLEEELPAHLPGVRFVRHDELGNIHGHDEHAVLAVLGDRLREKEIDAVIAGVGA